MISPRPWELGFGPLLAIGHWSLGIARVTQPVVNEQARDARGARGAGSGNGGCHATARSYTGRALATRRLNKLYGGCHATARSYTVRAPCAAQKSVAPRRMSGERKRKTEGSGLSMIARRSKSPSPRPSPGVPGEGAALRERVESRAVDQETKKAKFEFWDWVLYWPLIMAVVGLCQH
jgi:hypothetical protein